MGNPSELYEAILKGDAKTAEALTQEQLAAGTDAKDLLDEHLVPSMDEVGRRFDANEYFVPELLIAARAMKACMAGTSSDPQKRFS